MSFRVLILEDDEDFFRIVSLCLGAWRSDVQITPARSIAEGRKVLDSLTQPFSLAILDQHLPDGQGTELISHPQLRDTAVLAVSADPMPELPADTVRAGAEHFLSKRQVTEPLFLPLIEALIDRKHFEKELGDARLSRMRMDTIRVLLSTLRHEMNNPLGALLGGAYLLRTAGSLDPKQREALKVIEASSTRMKHVIEKLCEAADLEEVTKANEKVFQVPGDDPWEKD